MSVKKQTNVRTGKMARELMLADKEVSASLIMVYSNNGVNEEIKIEGLNQKSNEELFLSGNVDWNKSVIYKIVDFTGKAEVGKALLTDMKKNNITLEIERVMWSKDKQGEQDAESETEAPVAPKVEKPPVIHTKEPVIQSAPVKEAPAAAKPILTAEIVREAPQTAVKTESTPEVVQTPTAALQAVSTNHDDRELIQKYERLAAKAKEVCQDYDLGLDMDDSIEGLKEELQKQGISLSFDEEILDTLRRLRELQAKGISVDKILNLL